MLNGDIQLHGEVGRYGNTVKYRMGETYVEYTILDGTWKAADNFTEELPENRLCTSFTKLDGTALTSEFSATSNMYKYNVSDYLNSSSAACKMLIGENSHGFWLSDTYTYPRFGLVVYGFFACNKGAISGSSLYQTDTGDKTRENTYSVRPAVYLKSDVQFEKATTQINSTTTWNIK